MSRVVKPPKRRQRLAILWVAVTAAVVIALMATEQIALLYVLATLGVTGLLVIVAFADLSDSQGRGDRPASAEQIRPGVR